MRPSAEISVLFTRHQPLAQHDPIVTREIIMARLRGGGVVLCLLGLGHMGLMLTRDVCL